MEKRLIPLALISSLLLFACTNNNDKVTDPVLDDSVQTQVAEFDNVVVESFADVQILRYKINGFDKLTLKQKKLVYYLYEAGLSGRDIIWDQNYRHNLSIRGALENILKNFGGDKTSEEWQHFLTYTKQVWFANGIHHHYSMQKFKPHFTKTYFNELLQTTGTDLNLEAQEVIFNDADNKRVSLDADDDLILASANNFYQENITEKEVDVFYKKMIDKKDTTPIEYGLNSKLIKDDNGHITEAVYKVDGLYSEAILEVVKWLELAKTVAENKGQEEALSLLIDYYKTGDLETWSAYNVAWIASTDGDIDYIQGFVEVYGDSKGMRGTYESIVQIKDFEASDRMKVLAENVQWFEDKSSIQNEHKKPDVVGVTYNVVNVAGEAGDASPSTPIGVNLPNADWIRLKGSKSVSLGNIVEAYEAAGGEGILTEFAHDEEEIARTKAHGKLASKLHTAMHEVIGHASGKINKGIGTTKETLKNYSSTLEEARADLVALYFLMDNKLVNLGLMESLEVGMTEYDSYIRNGMMAQLRRLEPGTILEEAHMRNRQLVASWAFEKGLEHDVISKISRDGNTYFNINDYHELRIIFGELLREIQRIKSEGDYEAGKDLVENYGVQVDAAIHTEVLDRSAKLNIPPYNGFVNPVLEAVTDENGNISDIKISQPKDLETQMLFYSSTYGFLSKKKS